jgi:hypothetical protein
MPAGALFFAHEDRAHLEECGLQPAEVALDVLQILITYKEQLRLALRGLTG